MNQGAQSCRTGSAANKQVPVVESGGDAFAVAVVVGAVMIVGGDKVLLDKLLDAGGGNRRAVLIHSRRQSGICIRHFGNHGPLQTIVLTLKTLLGCSWVKVDGP